MDEKDILTSMLDMQRKSQEFRGFAFPMEGHTAAEYIKTHTLHCIDELCEMLHEVKGYKEWKVYDFSNEADNEMKKLLAKEELVDAVHFLMNIMLALGMSAKELYAMYATKSAVNYARLADTTNYKKDTEA